MTGPKLLGPNAANPATVGTISMEDYGQPPPPVNLPLITGIPSRYTNTGNTVSIAGYFSESLSDDQWQQLYSLLKTTLCKDQIP
jgi:hypothetical protein